MLRADGFEDGARVDLRRQRQLHEDAVDVAGSWLSWSISASSSACVVVGAEAVEPALHADFFAVAALVAHVDLAGRIVADEHGGERRRDAAVRR